MKVIITADIHCGYPRKVDDCIWALNKIDEYAEENGIDTAIIAGDLFHNKESINTEVLVKTYNFFNTSKLDWIAFPGNHDMFLKNSWSINSLRPMNRVMQVMEDVSLIKIYNHRFWVIPFINYEKVYMNVLSKVEEQYQEGDVLLTHVGTSGSILNECFLIKHWSVISFANSKFDRVFCGHFHCQQQVGENVWYPGSPIPFRFEEGFVEHGFITYDLESREVEFHNLFQINKHNDKIPPDYITITADEVDSFDLHENNYIRILPDREYTDNEKSQIRKKFIDNGARGVKFLKIKEQEINIQEHTKSMSDISDVFRSWVDHDDKVKGYNKQLLLKLNDQITSESKERIANQ